MTLKRIFSIFVLILIYNSVFAQLDSVIVEKYYISNASDAKDIQYFTNDNGDVTDTVVLEEGSTTYRVYMKLKPGYKITKVYGDANHALRIESTSNFYNHVKGASFGENIKDFNNYLITNKTLALDTWLTLGRASKTKFALLKTEDTDGSIFDGKNGYLTNNDPAAGIVLTKSDGLAPLTSTPSNLFQNGIINSISGEDSTIFGSLKPGNKFVSNNALIQNAGTKGVNPKSNKVLVAQLTTKGDISFALNVQLVDTLNPLKTLNFVADSVAGDLALGNVYNKLLKYPHALTCGCSDPDYFEYQPDRDCDDASLCKTKVVLGCMDPQACNYDPQANRNIQSMCCYPGNCSDRDISLVCPDLGSSLATKITLYPNPVNDRIDLDITASNNNETQLKIYNSFGRLMMVRNLGAVNGTTTMHVDVSNLESGLYMAQFVIGNHVESKSFIKNAY